MTKNEIILLLSVLVMALSSAFLVHSSPDYSPPLPPAMVSISVSHSEQSAVWDDEIEWAIYKLKYARMTHQLFIDNPWWCNYFTGDVQWHKTWVYNYTEVIRILREYGK